MKAVGPELPELKGMDMLLFAIPTPGLRSAILMHSLNCCSYRYSLIRKFLEGIKVKGLLDGDSLPLLAFVNKGIEAHTKALTLQVIAETLGHRAARVATFIVRAFASIPATRHEAKDRSEISRVLRSRKRVRGTIHFHKLFWFTSVRYTVVKRQPTTVSVASLSEECAAKVAALFHQPWFRCYPGKHNWRN